LQIELFAVAATIVLFKAIQLIGEAVSDNPPVVLFSNPINRVGGFRGETNVCVRALFPESNKWANE
jgi:hypothetical protein